MNNNSNIVLLLISIIIVILASVSYLEFKKIKIELDKYKEILSNYKEKIELLLDLNKKIMQDINYTNQQESQQYVNQPIYTKNHTINNPIQVKEPEEIQVKGPEEIQVQEPEEIQVEEPEEIQVGEPENIHVGEPENIHVGEPENIHVGEPEEEKNTININFDNLDDILVNISSDEDNVDPIEEVLNNKELFNKYIKKSIKELRKILIEKNLPLSGNKTTLVKRILDNL